MASYDATTAQPPVVFPLLGPPVSVALGCPSHRGLMRSVHDERTDSNFVELNDDIHQATTLEKFIMEPSQKKVGLLHVKCCANNKYWVAQQLRPADSGPWFICTSADKPQDDLDKPSCTLFHFRPHPAYDTGVVRIFHAQHNKYASVFYMSGQTRGKTYLKLRDDQRDGSALNTFSVRGVSPQIQLPRYVAFKSASGKYLAVKEPYLTKKDPYLQFSSSEITDPAVVHETFTDEYGVVRIRSIGSGKFWRLRVNGWISADSNNAVAYDTDHVYRGDVDALFKVVVRDDNYIALQNISNSKFCKVLSDQEGVWLSASGEEDSSDTMLVWEEPIRSRKIYDVIYRVGGTKTSTNTDVRRTEVLHSNSTHQLEHNTASIELHDKKETSWKWDVTGEYAIETHLKVSLPIKKLKLEGQAGPHFEIKGQYTKEASDKKETTRVVEYTYPVPPMTRVVCTHFTRQDVVDIPYSYKQKVVLFNGEIAPPREFHDGVFRSVSSFDTDIDTHEEKITGDA